LLNNLADVENQVVNAEETNFADLHNLIVLNHDDILLETLEVLNNHVYVELDSPEYLNIDNAWKPIWLKFMGEYTKIIDSLPNLKRIISLFPNIIGAYISVLAPGTVIVDHKADPWIKRYQYGLQVVDNDVGLKIGDAELSWNNQKGYLWSGTKEYYVWNNTSANRIVLVIDMCEELTPKIINWLHGHNSLIVENKEKIL
jgi:aspartyl/asparaginyl beta-hydroxylase (cupin superfamily)